jgi:prevent-host-death family protein
VNVGVREAKAMLSALIRRVRRGLPVTITQRGVPVVELRKVSRASKNIDWIEWPYGTRTRAGRFAGPVPKVQRRRRKK